MNNRNRAKPARSGPPPRKSENLAETRKILWRLNGDLYNRITDLADKMGTSHNRVITLLVMHGVEELEENYEEAKPKYNKPYVDRRFKNKIRP